jgi:hypothetical protein
MNEITEFEKFHPRAVKLLRKRKQFIVVACDEPYFMEAYSLIRSHETTKGSWSDMDERVYRDAQLRIGADDAGQATDPKPSTSDGNSPAMLLNNFCYKGVFYAIYIAR